MFGVIFFNYYINGAPNYNEYIHLARAPICKEYIHLARAHKCYRESTFSYGICTKDLPCLGLSAFALNH